MEFYQLENFVAVAEERGFTRAADRMFRSQAAVSVAIRKLEEELGLALIVRDSHPCELTEAGLVLLEHARQLLALRNETQRNLAEFTALSTGRVRIAAHESTAQYLLPAPLAAFHRLFPDIKIETLLCNVNEIATLVSERRADLGLGIRQQSLKGLRSEPILSDPLVLITAPDSPLLGIPTLTIANLGRERFFVHHLQTSTSDEIQRVFDAHQTTLNIVAELWNFETVKQFVAAGSGVAVIPLSVARGDFQTGRLATAPVDGLSITRPIDVVYRESGKLLPAPTELLALLRGWTWHEGRVDTQETKRSGE